MTTATAERATERQVAFLNTLRSERGLSPETSQLTKRQASQAIDDVKAMPRRPLPRQESAAAAASIAAELTPGVYRTDGVVYVVKPNQAKTRLYAKRLVELTSSQGDRLSEADEHVRVDFEYAPGAIYTIKPEHRMPLAEGRALTVRYGRCICCNRKLKVAESVERGIGPVCAGYFA